MPVASYRRERRKRIGLCDNATCKDFHTFVSGLAAYIFKIVPSMLDSMPVVASCGKQRHEDNTLGYSCKVRQHTSKDQESGTWELDQSASLLIDIDINFM
jgi:hypothetical protein